MENKKIITAIGIAAAVIILGLIGFTIFLLSNNAAYSDKAVYNGYEDAGYGDTFAKSMGETESYAPSEDVEGNAADNGDALFATEGKDQKLVYTGSVTIGTNSIKKSYEKVTSRMKEYGAFFESVNESSGYKEMIIRVPKKEYMKFYDSLSEIDGTITSSNIDVTDETKRYTDNEKRIDILQSEYDELKDLLKKANTVEEVLSIRSRMSDVTYELESLKGSNETIDYISDYGRLDLTLSLNGTHDEASFGHQIREAFSNGIYLFKMIILGLINIWWVILIIAYGVLAFRKKLWPFRHIKKK